MLGSRSYGPLRRVLLGSVSTLLVCQAACPLLIVPRGAVEAPAAMAAAGYLAAGDNRPAR